MIQNYNLKVFVIEKYSHVYTWRHVRCNIAYDSQSWENLKGYQRENKIWYIYTK